MTNAILLDERGRFKSGGTISRPTFRLPKLFAACERYQKIFSGGKQS